MRTFWGFQMLRGSHIVIFGGCLRHDAKTVHRSGQKPYCGQLEHLLLKNQNVRYLRYR